MTIRPYIKMLPLFAALAIAGCSIARADTGSARQFVLIGSYQGIQIYCPGRVDDDEFRGRLADGKDCFLVGLPSDKAGLAAMCFEAGRNAAELAAKRSPRAAELGDRSKAICGAK